MSFWPPLGRGYILYGPKLSATTDGPSIVYIGPLHCVFQVIVVLGRGDASDGFARVHIQDLYGSPCPPLWFLRTALLFAYSVWSIQRIATGWPPIVF
jgi:hypothetical protein